MEELILKYPTIDQTKGATARRTALDFGLTARALSFARLYAENPRLGATQCARQAGYASRCKSGAHVRANELLRDPRVIQAILYFSAKPFIHARAEAVRYFTRLAETEGRLWSGWDRVAFEHLMVKLEGLQTHTERVEKIYESGVLRGL